MSCPSCLGGDVCYFTRLLQMHYGQYTCADIPWLLKIERCRYQLDRLGIIASVSRPMISARGLDEHLKHNSRWIE